MPVKVFDFAPSPLNTSNDISASGFYNSRTYQPTNAGGLCLGDAIDLTNFEAANLSQTSVGTLFEGRYRRIQVDANAVAANVARGKAAYVVPGSSLFGAFIVTAGSGQTPGTYQIAGTGGGGTGAVLQVVVSAAGTITAQPTVVAAGSGYTSTPTFTVAAGGTPGTVRPQMIVNSYIVTDRSNANANLSEGRGIFLNSITPGNFGWIQENGIATFLVGTGGASGVGIVLSPFTPTDGTFIGIAQSTSPLVSAFGTSIDSPVSTSYVRGLMTLPVWNG
jgi:hypothetical protein